LEEFFQLVHNPVRPFPRLALDRLDLQSHFLDDVSADEPANAVVLPVGRLRDLGKSGAILALHQFQYLLRLTSGSGGAFGFGRFRRLLRLNRFVVGFRLLRVGYSPLLAVSMLNWEPGVYPVG